MQTLQTLFVIGLIHGIPVTIVIWLIFKGLQNVGKIKLAIQTRKILFIALALYILGWGVYDWWSRRYWVSGLIKEHYQVELYVIELNSFLDAPTEFEIEITDLKTGKELSHEFSTIFDACLSFQTFGNEKDVLVIEGCGRDRLNIWFDFDKGEVLDNRSVQEKNDAIREVARLNPLYEIEVIK